MRPFILTILAFLCTHPVLLVGLPSCWSEQWSIRAQDWERSIESWYGIFKRSNPGSWEKKNTAIMDGHWWGSVFWHYSHGNILTARAIRKEVALARQQKLPVVNYMNSNHHWHPSNCIFKLYPVDLEKKKENRLSIVPSTIQNDLTISWEMPFLQI